ncbi:MULTISPECIES: 4'-phosphopantetheinyl transferase family protein [Streptomycetaceae]|uniref:Putative Sfp type phosphopantetheinyl transferase n=1 Tax=Streptantibioticus cattleyicolor (strain ATCC 35852 / DSM 46488 / JCM 4925 / NBRC 14057 / NRRL 8057) TaxID=1003195 RepID=F8K1F1_STREN|nr:MULTISPECIES: 4'-phosphopantetheinyl transferase superfamily protein [Streptomycetaceae]AEW97447.1 putative Sfp type phosphopantetheinyl transferase [Streptantibioticus cattleyicolor NRRL 8057 = DSM 46488]MYS61883.1 4'-phosphopantetheinyl transferase superfamily protein [Streptomyces sp. SID5468]CCB77766.1 putative Sfp type phosphopantetheinyl transferase [Streptantibioticus cattleyicolor NRRL 8057 = DSM 46488]
MAAEAAAGRAAGTTAAGRPADGLMPHLLPEDVEVAEAFADPPHAELFPQEAEAVARAVDKRRREYTTVRMCARTALGRLGIPPVPILRGPKGEPRWPAGIVGSMTHCDGYRAAAVARDDRVASLGVDAEPNQPLPDGVLETVTRPEERPHLARLAAAHPATCWDRLLFSAKESVYKTWFPLTGRWLGFEECVVVPDPDDGTFTATLTVPGPRVAGREITRFTGRWRTWNGLVATAIAVTG